MNSVATPRTSYHAELRMLQRAGIDVPTVLHSWKQATPITIEYKNYSQAKYDETLEAILLERDGVVTTVLRAAYEEFANSEEGQ